MNIDVQRDQAVQKLRDTIAPGATIYVVLRHQNPPETCQWLEFYHIHGGRIKLITVEVGLAIKAQYCPEHNTLKISGKGLDTAYASVANLSTVLFGNGVYLKHQWL